MRIPPLALALLALVLLGAGCKKASPLLGKWNASAGGGTVDLEFKPDGTFASTVKAGASGLTSSGDYALTGERLRMTTKDVQAPGLSPDLLAKLKADPTFGKPQEVAAKFASDDELSLSGFPGTGSSAGAVTLKRVKEDAK